MPGLEHRPQTTLLQKIALHEAAGDRVDEEILKYLKQELTNICYRSVNDETYRISHVTMNGRTFQFNLCNNEEGQTEPVAVEKPEYVGTGAESVLGKVLNSIHGRLLLHDSSNRNRDGDLVPIDVEGGCELHSEEY
jgi:hypothetical protein